MKKVFTNLKLFFIAFSVCFTLLFALFSIDAIYSITKYRIVNFKSNFLNSLRRPISFETSKPPLALSNNTSNENVIVDTLSQIQSTLNINRPIIFREPLPEVPSEALTQNLLVIPKFDITAPIGTVASENKKEIYASLKKGVTVYPTTSTPGGEYSIILGHSSRYPWEPGKYKAVFSLLNELVVGDRINVFWNQKALVYEVVDKKIFLPYPKGEGYTENIFPPNSSEKTIILQSCWPVGVDYKRIAIKTKLINW